MRRLLHARLLASALAVSFVPLVVTAMPAVAQDYGDVSFDSFHDALAQYGYWGYSDRWGLVWQPGQVDADFRPYYSRGHWVYTDDYGWYWTSEYPWGDIAFHYGRWVNDPDDGWLWIPGYTWSPGWVTWRSNGQYIGWMPAPPDRAFLQGSGDVSFGLSFGGGGVSLGFNNDPYYGYRSWYGPGFDERSFANNWVFVGAGNVADTDYRTVSVRDPARVMNIIRQTRDVTHYTVVNNYVVNKSIDVHAVERASGHPIRITPARSVIRQPNLVMRADAGQRIQMRERAIAPRGSGFANSAPPPPAAVVSKLSPNVPPHNGGGSQHLFSKTTISSPETQSHFHGAPVGQQPKGGPAGMTGPGGTNEPGTQSSGENRRSNQGPQGNAPGQMNGPGNSSGQGNTPRPTDEYRDRGPQGSGAGGMNGPGNEPGSNPQPDYRHRDQGPQGGGPGGMNGPGTPNGPAGSNGPGGPGAVNAPANQPPPQTTEPRHRAPPSPEGTSGPGGMNAPANQPPPTTEPRHRAPPNPEGTSGPGSMNGPGSGSTPPGDTGHRSQGPASGPPASLSAPKPAPTVQPAPPPANEATTPPEKKKHKPDQPPPGSPQ